jgi:predicted alpha/beta superfamily hydrolase
MITVSLRLLPLVVCLLLTGCSISSSPARIADPLFGLGDRDQFSVRSERLRREFHVLIRLPRDYSESGRDYPMVVLLDGGILFPMLAPYQLMMEVQGSADEVIVVGVSYGGLGYSNGNLRSTDFTAPSPTVEHYGGAAAYQAFLADTLLPRLLSDYRVDPAKTLLMGQSLGGQFAIHAALTRPELFSTFVAVNPALHANLAYFLRSDWPPTEARTRLIVALGGEDDPRFRGPALSWLEAWEKRDDRPFDLEHLPLPGEHHATSAPAAYFEAISRLFPPRAI